MQSTVRARGRRRPTLDPRPARRGRRGRRGRRPAPIGVLTLLLCLLLCPTTLAGNARAASPEAGGTSQARGTAPRLILVSWDAGGDELIDRLLAEGSLPHLGRLAERGARAAHTVGTVPTKTAPSHATIYTGCGPGVHGVASNSVIYADRPGEHTALERYRGFSSTALRAEPIFVSSARQGFDTVVLAASHYEPFADLRPWLENDAADRLRTFSSFEDRLVGAAVFDADDFGATFLAEPSNENENDLGWSDLPPHRGPVREIDLGASTPNLATPLFALAYDSPDDPVDGLDRVLIRVGSRGADARAQSVLRPSPAPAPDEAAPGESAPGESVPGESARAVESENEAESERRRRLWSSALPIRATAERGGLGAHTFFRLFDLAPDGSSLALYRRKASAQRGHHDPADLEALEQHWPGGFDDPFRPYQRNRLGLPLPMGGDGTAEQRLVEIAAFEADLLIAGSRFAWHTWQPRVLLHYTPMTDQAAHAWMAALDPESPFWSDESGPKLWRAYARLVAEKDRWLGALVDLAGDDTVLALVSDHGMAWSDRDFFPNRALEQAGLVVRDAEGGIDLSRSRAFIAELDFAVRINDRRFAGGIVGPEERPAVLRQAIEALLSARDPETGRALVHRVFTAEELAPHHLSDPRRPDALAVPELFFDLAPGVYPRFGLPEAVAAAGRAPWGAGTHGYWPERRDMHSIFYLAGPGVRSGVETPPVFQFDIAPTLAVLLGMEPPRQSCGRVVFEALAREGVLDPAPAPAATPVRPGAGGTIP